MTWNPNSCHGGRTLDAATDHHAVGVAHGKNLQITVRFDPETFQAIRARAWHEKTSVAEQVRRLVEWGLESLDA